jgi:hypothetical protein
LAPIPVAIAWNVNPAEPVSVTLVAFDDPPEAARWAWVSGGGSKSFVPVGTRLAAGGIFASRPTVVFTQSMAAGQARGSRSDDLPARGARAGTLNLVAITQ